jgi:hypothetical protein
MKKESPGLSGFYVDPEKHLTIRYCIRINVKRKRRGGKACRSRVLQVLRMPAAEELFHPHEEGQIAMDPVFPLHEHCPAICFAGHDVCLHLKRGASIVRSGIIGNPHLCFNLSILNLEIA